MILCLVCLAAILVCAVTAVMVRSTFKSAVALALASVMLGVVMYLMGAPWAALFEISVCSGFVTVIFISAVTMTSRDRKEQDEIYGQEKHTRLLPWLLIGGGVVLIAALLLGRFGLPQKTGLTQGQADFPAMLWREHKDLLFALLAALLSGTFAVVVLFKEEEKK